MDGFEKLGMGVLLTILVIILGIIGLFGWGFVEFIQWVTSK